MKYLSLETAIKIHDEVIKNSGGLAGINNIGQLDSVLQHIQNDKYYTTFIDKLTHLVFSSVKFHTFLDGNKRSSILFGVHLLNLNQYGYAGEDFIRAMESVVVEVAENKISK